MVDKTYSPNKTILLKKDNLNTTDTQSAAPKSSHSAIVNYPSHKSVNLSIGVNEVKEIEKPSEKKAIEDQSNNSNTFNVSTINNVALKAYYLSHKTVDLSQQVAPEKIEVKPKEGKTAEINKPSTSPSLIVSKGNYPSHKTINLTDSTILIQQEEKPFEAKKAIDIKTTIVNAEQTIVENFNSDTNAPLFIEKLSEKKIEFTSKVEITPISGVKQPTIDTLQAITGKEEKKENYPASKTILINSEESIKPAMVDKTDLKVEPVISELTKTMPDAGIKTSEKALTNYPDHKSFSFVKNENKTSQINQVAPALVKDEKAVLETAKVQTAGTATKAKKPIFWMSLSAVIFIASATTVWFSYHQQNALKDEILALKTNKEELTDSIMKLQKNKLQFDDIIIRGGKIDTKNNISIVNAAAESEAIRICFSITDNPSVPQGKKIVYVRFIGPDNKILMKAKDNMFDYKGNQIPFSLKEEINYKNKEMMLCLDYKLEEKLLKGLYKAEIYNEGVLDGTGSFELK